ncbi:Nicotine blue oxidoreductase [Austwickia sp. TVS 96-490-7B]|nr:Nicotine blue oxidoreductase [Austwickia sp. TVS 96-490-7B]
MVLAAGAGRRYGGPKILAQGGAWVRRAVEALYGGGCDHVVVVMGAAVVEPPLGALTLVNPLWQEGLRTSVALSLDWLTTSGAQLGVWHLVDLPDVGPQVVARVVQAAGDTGIARATYGGKPGHPVVVRREFWSAMGESVADPQVGDQGAGGWLARARELRGVECGDLASGQDRDRRED